MILIEYDKESHFCCVRIILTKSYPSGVLSQNGFSWIFKIVLKHQLKTYISNVTLVKHELIEHVK